MTETKPEQQSASQTSPFATSPHPRLSGSTVLLFLIAAILVFGGFYLMGAAFSVTTGALWMFAGGLAADTLGFWLVFGIIPNRGRA